LFLFANSLSRKDFYLIPLKAGQGTVNPTYYRVLEDGIDEFSMDHYQMMAYRMSFGYYNWTVSRSP
jgi:hypothetical protein